MLGIVCLKCPKNVSRQGYDNYIQKGIDLEDVSPLEDSWLESIQEMIPCHLQSLSTPFHLLVDEIREEYLLSVKEAIGILSTFNINLCHFVNTWPKNS